MLDRKNGTYVVGFVCKYSHRLGYLQPQWGRLMPVRLTEKVSSRRVRANTNRQSHILTHTHTYTHASKERGRDGEKSRSMSERINRRERVRSYIIIKKKRWGGGGWEKIKVVYVCVWVKYVWTFHVCNLLYVLVCVYCMSVRARAVVCSEKGCRSVCCLRLDFSA